MGTHNGYGTMFYGWRHLPDGTAIATKWVTLFYIPIFPSERHRLRVLTDFRRERTHVRARFGGLLGVDFIQVASFEHLERLPLAWNEVGKTYLRTFFGLPLLLLWPVIPLWLLWLAVPHIRAAFQAADPGSLTQMAWNAARWLSVGATVVLGLLLIVNILFQPLSLLRQARGQRPPKR